MNETAKTLAFAGVASVLLAAAALATWLPDWRGPGAGFDDQGEPFFPAFAEAVDDDPLAAKVLEVVSYDEDTAQVRPFQVEFNDGAWTIPSHHDYPADAEDRMAGLAAQVSELTKGAIRSDRASDFEELGVIDPMDEKTTSLKGRGTRITLRGSPDGEPLADLILGRPVPDREGLRYVRVPGKNRVYAAEVDLDLTTRFADWIDTDLLDVTPAQAQVVSYDTRKIDPDRRAIQPGDPVVLTREEGDEWTLKGLEADSDQEVDTSKVNDLIRAVDNLKIVGVRPLPRGTDNAALRSLASKGFYLTQQDTLLSNEGSLSLATDEGILYTLRFGEVTLADGDELTAGVGEDRDESAEDESTDPESTDADTPQSGQTEGRYLIVAVGFDETYLPDEDDADSPDALPDDVFARVPDDPARVEAEAKRAEEAERKQEERQSRIDEAKARVAELDRQFANWYYVVPGDDFRQVALDRSAFLKAAGAPDASEEAPPTPSFGPGDFDPRGGLPPGLNFPGLGGPQG